MGAIVLVYFLKYEGFGLFILEVMVCGCLVIICKIVLILEVVGIVVLYINDNDINSLVNVLGEV